jgi:RNA-splicing ligase RtcB
MRLCQRWARLNRRLIADLITDFLEENHFARGVSDGAFESVHNYISDDNLIRKGAISAQTGERCIIPLNMRDGSLICIGKGNADWNCSAPHGAGRVMSRAKAFKELRLEDFKSSMEGIYSETVTNDTLDEAPMAYKPKDEILANIQDTVSVENIIKPVFNFKAAE